jgi:hypothetical protein
MSKQPLEKSDNQAVALASGKVDAASVEMPWGILKQIFSSATVYSL